MKLNLRIFPKLILGIVLSLGFSAYAADSATDSATEVLQQFYQKYLNGVEQSAKRPLQLRFSKSLQALVKQDEKTCKTKALKGDVCGFGADSDIYLDAQDFDSKLNAKNSGLAVTETQPGEVLVSFKLFPNDKDAEMVKIHFKMIRENGKWVVDDIIYGSGSARKRIQEEIDSLK